jgi:TetR/AcrR family transcriptional repressor of nem operon
VKASERRASILASAAPIFNRHGFAGTSISDVLNAADLEKGGLYNHFSSKEELAVAAFDYAFGKVRAYFVEALNGVESGAPHLRAYVDAFERYVERPVVAGGCPVANATFEADDALPFLRVRVQAAFREIRGSLHRHVLRAIEKGHFRRDVDADGAADFLIAALEGSLLLARGLRHRGSVHRVAATLQSWLTSLER